MGRREEMVKLAQDMMENKDNIRNIGIVAHIDHGKTTMTDSLIAAAGLMSEELAGKQCLMDFYELEQQRGITINAANISVVYKHEDKPYLINVIDTPGHVDFGGDVIRAMRAVDGVIVLVDAVEGVMPQTETVIRQALRENCKPVLFVNKVDRLINELKVSEDEMQDRLIKAISKVNTLIKKNAPKQFAEKWIAKVEDGSVTFGSGLYKWAISVPKMKETGVSFKEIYKYCKEGKMKELSAKIPLYRALMDMIIRHLPSPVEAQKYRIPEIWKGEIESETGKAMLNCSSEGPLAMMVTDVVVDPHAGEIATGRVYSGKITRGMKVFLINSKKEVNVQAVGVYMGPERVNMEFIPAGNIAAISGTKEVYAGETIATEQIQPFESFKSSVEPVMTVSIEAKKTADLPKLIEVLKQVSKEDPNVVATINQETGEHLVSGMGELHLEVTRYRIEVDHNVPIEVSQPIVVYKETTLKKSPSYFGKSPNKHNQFKISVEPIKPEILEKLIESKLEGKIRKKDIEKMAKLEEIGFSKDDAKNTWWVHNNNVLIDWTKGVQAIQEIKELVCQGFVDAMNEGPLAKEKCYGLIVRLEDAKLHEDAIHRGPAQVLPAITRTIYACMLSANAVLLEPRQKMFLSVPQDYMGAVSRELQQRRATINEIQSEGDQTIVIAIAPVKELIGFSSAIRGATQGRAIWTAEFYDYKALPESLQKEVIKQVRTRKGMEPEPKPAAFFLE
ncbi:MAG: elongation factor EF-2 [Candidatus Diapherotrites archaeon]